MKKYLLSVLVISLLVFILFCGCFGEEQKTNNEKLIGTWIAEDSDYRMFEFKSDGTCLINIYELEGTYYINDENQLIINQTNPSEVYIYDYTLNYNNDKLTLTEEITGDHHVFRRQ
jgi:hypothetical protein